MTDSPGYSDPIVIPITITIPDPRPPPATDRWGQLGPAIHPSVDDPGWFQRQTAKAARNLANLKKVLEWPSVGSLSRYYVAPATTRGRQTTRPLHTSLAERLAEAHPERWEGSEV